MPFRKIALLFIMLAHFYPDSLPASIVSFRIIESLDGDRSTHAYAVSDDGSTVVGTGRNADALSEAFRWTTSDGTQGLGIIGPPNSTSFAYGTSSDGSVIVGVSGGEPYRWTTDAGMQALEQGGTAPTAAYGVSGDGKVAVGFDVGGPRISYYEAVRWAPQIEWLGQLSRDFLRGQAFAASSDGSVVVGQANIYTDGGEAFRWENGVMTGLGFNGPEVFSAGSPLSNATDVTPDGTITVGGSTKQAFDVYEAFRWTQSGGFSALGDLPGGRHWSEATGVSADASVIVGNSSSSRSPDPTFADAFIWDPLDGMRDLREVLVQGGVDLSMWPNLQATDISADGRTIVGTAFSAGYQIQHAFVVTVPEPRTAILAGLGLVALVAFTRRHRLVHAA